MYESYFGFKDTPFRLSADEKFRYAHNNYMRASANLAYALEQGEGFVMITGQPGSGKTTLIRDVISELDEARYNVLNIVTSQLHAEELLRKVALEYGLDAENANKATLLTHISKHLSSLHEEGKKSLLFLDEAQNLCQYGLEELRLLSNLQQGKHSLLQIVLVGHNELRQLVLGPDMQHVQQRLVASCQIESLAEDQTREYINHRLRHVDWQGDPKIEDEAYHLIHLASRGVPRNINHLMSHLLLLAALEEKHQLNDEEALAVIEELYDQQRITLAEGKSFESFANGYREQKQHQVKHHAVASASVVSLASPDVESWDHRQQDNRPTAPQNISKLNIPLDADMEPAGGAELEDIDSDWLDWGGGTGVEVDTETLPVEEGGKRNDDTIIQPSNPVDSLLPNADDIWNGAMESTDMETLFPANRRGKSPYSVEPSSDESDTEPDEEPIPQAPEDRWGGVWFMSSQDSSTRSGIGHNRKKSTIKDLPRKSASLPKQNNNISVDENLSVPSVWVDEFPEIIPTESDTAYHTIPVNSKTRVLKRSIMHILAFVSVGLMAMLAIRLFPDLFGNSRQDQVRQENSHDTIALEPPVSPKPVEREDRSQPGTPSTNIKASLTTEILSLPIAQETSEVEPAGKVITPLSQPPQKVTPSATPIRADIATLEVTPPPAPKQVDIVTSVEASPYPDDSDIDSYHHIELARRYFVYFDFNDFSVPAEHMSLLKSIRDKMLLEERNFLQITGYADSQGDVNYNRSLSLKRAEAVKEFFTIRGISDDRLKLSAVGAISNGNPKYESIDKRRLVRRVEVILFPNQKITHRPGPTLPANP